MLNENRQLCMECEKLDLDACYEDSFKTFQRVTEGSEPLSDSIFKTPGGTYFYNNAILVHKFGSRLSKLSECPLCIFFRSLRVQPDPHERHKLLAFRSSHSWLLRTDLLEDSERKSDQLRKYKDTVFMAVVPDIDGIPSGGHEYSWLDHDIPATGVIYRLVKGDDDRTQDRPLLTARELDDKFDVDRVRFWLDVCQRTHGSACKQRTLQEPIMHGFRLIDCTKISPVVEEVPWGSKYAALSYVWGSEPEDREDWARTVLDAVEVTKNLGLQYLWVDRCCIDQSNLLEMDYAISKMTTIYEGAEFTIIAAAGTGASYGLPGVRSTSRTPQPKYRLNSGSLLLSQLRDPRRDILESKYWTRGWTYQEGVLSNRRIVFTDSQVYWECNCMAIHESAVMPLFQKVAYNNKERHSVMADFMLSGIFKGGSHGGVSSSGDDDSIISNDDIYRLNYGFPFHQEITIGAQLRGLDEHIREFSKRELTKKLDTLAAFQGIVGLYTQTPQIFIYLGLPMWIGDISGATSGAQVSFALSVSSWYHRTGPDQLMFVSQPCQRKGHLPSWTWAGWVGTVTWRAPPQAEHSAYMRDLVNARIPSLVWAADITLSDREQRSPIQLLGSESAVCMTHEMPTLMEIKNPYILSSWERVEDKDREWSWTKRMGRPGREQATSERTDWDAKWYRIGRRLSCIGMSIAMTGEQWTALHASGEVISVLMFAGRYTHVEHGTARFLTLRRVQSAPERWERIGTLYLILPFLGKCTSVAFQKVQLHSYTSQEMGVLNRVSRSSPTAQVGEDRDTLFNTPISWEVYECSWTF